MKNHELIDKRSLLLAKAVVKKIDSDPNHKGLEKAYSLCLQWSQNHKEHVIEEWLDILKKPWESVREILLDTTEKGTRLRQSSPFCSILTPQERWHIYKEFSHYATP